MRYQLSLFLFLLIDAGLVLAEPVIKQSKALSPVTGGTVIQWFLGLMVVLAIIVGCSWLLRRYGNLSTNTGGGLNVLEGISVGTREKVLLLQAGKKQLVIGVAPGQVNLLQVLEESEQIEGKQSAKNRSGGPAVSFSDHLRQLTGKEKNEARSE